MSNKKISNYQHELNVLIARRNKIRDNLVHGLQDKYDVFVCIALINKLFDISEKVGFLRERVRNLLKEEEIKCKKS